MRTFRIHGPDDVKRMFQEILASYLSARPTPVLRETITDLERLSEGYFERDAGPGGQAWPPNTAATVASKGHGDILENTLKMRNAMTKSGVPGAVRDVFDEGHHAGLAYGLDDNEIPYWKYHDIRGGSLPYRPFIGIGMPELDVVSDRLLDNQLETMVKDA